VSLAKKVGQVIGLQRSAHSPALPEHEFSSSAMSVAQDILLGPLLKLSSLSTKEISDIVTSAADDAKRASSGDSDGAGNGDGNGDSSSSTLEVKLLGGSLHKIQRAAKKKHSRFRAKR